MNIFSQDDQGSAADTAPGLQMLKAVWGLGEGQDRQPAEHVVPVSSDIYRVPPLRMPVPRRSFRSAH
jgi:hypothetical protein